MPKTHHKNAPAKQPDTPIHKPMRIEVRRSLAVAAALAWSIIAVMTVLSWLVPVYTPQNILPIIATATLLFAAVPLSQRWLGVSHVFVELCRTLHHGIPLSNLVGPEAYVHAVSVSRSSSHQQHTG